jgi:hypothetical protein
MGKRHKTAPQGDIGHTTCLLQTAKANCYTLDTSNCFNITDKSCETLTNQEMASLG